MAPTSAPADGSTPSFEVPVADRNWRGDPVDDRVRVQRGGDLSPGNNRYSHPFQSRGRMEHPVCSLARHDDFRPESEPDLPADDCDDGAGLLGILHLGSRFLCGSDSGLPRG